MQSRAVRALRGVTAASVATFVAMFSHVAGGGQPPGWLGLLAPLVLATMVCTLLAGRQLSLARLALSVGVAQLLFHGLFVLGTPRTTAGPSPLGHHGSTEILLVATGMHTHTDSAMWVGHGIAAVITTAVIYYAQRMIISVLVLARKVAAWVLRITSPTRIHAVGFPPAPLATGTRILALPLGIYRPNVSWRGPPPVLSF